MRAIIFLLFIASIFKGYGQVYESVKDKTIFLEDTFEKIEKPYIRIELQLGSVVISKKSFLRFFNNKKYQIDPIEYIKNELEFEDGSYVAHYLRNVKEVDYLKVLAEKCIIKRKALVFDTEGRSIKSVMIRKSKDSLNNKKRSVLFPNGEEFFVTDIVFGE
ncbi:hypothetical protein [Ekhidna sp.]